MSEKLITLITGANQGIGYYAAQQLASSGKYHVLLGSRDQQKGQKAVQAIVDDGSVPVKAEDIEALQIDVDSDESIAQAEKVVRDKFGRLDILINNAGISTAPSAPTLRGQYQAIYNTNLFGAAVTTETFTPLLRLSTSPSGKRIIFTSSSTASFAIATPPDTWLPANLYPLYRSTKSALNMIMANYHFALKDEGFVVGALCPGHCGTNLNGYQGRKDPRVGAKTIVRAVEARKGEVECRVIHDDDPKFSGEGGVVPW